MPPFARTAAPRNAQATSDEIRSALIDLLGASSRSSTTSELRVRLRARGFRLADYELTRVLRGLRAEGQVKLERGRWSAPEHSSASQGTATQTPGTTQPLERFPKVKPGWSPRESWLFGNEGSSQGPDLDSESDISGIEDTGPWSAFRKLLDYYTDCVRNDEGCEASANV